MSLKLMLDRRLVVAGLAVGIGFTVDAFVGGLVMGRDWWWRDGTFMFDIWGILLGLVFAGVSWWYQVFGKVKRRDLWLVIWEGFGEYLLLGLLAWIFSLMLVILTLASGIERTVPEMSLTMTIEQQVRGLGYLASVGWIDWVRFFWWSLLGPVGAYWGTGLGQSVRSKKGKMNRTKQIVLILVGWLVVPVVLSALSLVFNYSVDCGPIWNVFPCGEVRGWPVAYVELEKNNCIPSNVSMPINCMARGWIISWFWFGVNCVFWFLGLFGLYLVFSVWYALRGEKFRSKKRVKYKL